MPLSISWKKVIKDITNTYIPLNSQNTKHKKMFSSAKKNLRPLPTDAEDENINGSNIFGTGLTNDSGEFNCFLNVIIQVGSQ